MPQGASLYPPASREPDKVRKSEGELLERSEEVEDALALVVAASELGACDDVCSEDAEVGMNIYFGLCSIADQLLPRLEHHLRALAHDPSQTLTNHQNTDA